MTTHNLKLEVTVRLDLDVPADTSAGDVARAVGRVAQDLTEELVDARFAAPLTVVLGTWHRRNPDGSFTGRMG